MTTYLFSALTNDQLLSFDPDLDVLHFDGATDQAGNIRFVTSGGLLGVLFLGKTVWLDAISLGHLTSTNVTFANGSLLGVGDDGTGLFRDWYGALYDLRTAAGSHHINGLGGADLVMGGSGNDYIVGNDALTPLIHVSRVGSDGSPNNSYLPSISADGRFVGFYGGWTEFGSQTNSATDVFVKDLLTGTVTNEHKTINGDFALSGSGVPRISADGNWLVFWSNSNLTLEVPAVGSQIYVADTRSGAVQVASVTQGGLFANNPTDNPDISATGRYVVFETRADNLAAGANVNIEDIYLKDMQTGALTRVSTSLTGGDANAEALDPAISANGRYVVFSSAATNLTANKTGNGYADIYLYDRVTDTLKNITGGKGGSYSSLNPDVGADSAGGVTYGGIVVFETGKKLVADDTNNTTDIYAYDISDGTYQRVSTRADGSQVGVASGNAVVSGDGRFVAFVGGSDSLVPGDTNGYRDVFVKDLITGDLALVSRLPGVQANQHSGSTLDISLGGDWIVFESSASNLADSDDNGGLTDVFRVANPLLRDVLMGGAGNDTYVLSRRDVVVENPGEGVDTVRAGFSYALGDNVENLVLTGVGNFSGQGNLRNNAITGNAGNNALSGGSGADVIAGAAGSDTITGGVGRDVMNAGNDLNRDVFVFAALSHSLVGASRDVIGSFDSGEDDIDLRGIDAHTGVGGNQAFLFNGTVARAHSVWVVDTGADLLIRGDVSGDRIADFEVKLLGVSGVVAGDFLL